MISNYKKMIDKNIETNRNIIFTDKIKIGEKTKKEIKEIFEVNYQIEKYNSLSIPTNYLHILLEVANNGFGISMGLEDIKNHIYKSDEVFLLRINGEIVGFSSIANLDNFVYRFGTVIKKEYQNNGLYTILNKVIFDSSKQYFVRTQNKNVIKSLQDSFNIVFYGKKALNYLKEKGLSKERISKFMIEKGDKEETLCELGIFNGVYGGKMGEKDRVNYIDEEFYSGFNSEKGDSLLVIYTNKY